MTRGVDRDDPLRAGEVPLELGSSEGSEHGTAGAVDMNGDRDARLGLVFVKEMGHQLHVLVVAGVGGSCVHWRECQSVGPTKKNELKEYKPRMTKTPMVFCNEARPLSAGLVNLLKERRLPHQRIAWPSSGPSRSSC